jgi:hypothetical protein
LNKYSLFSLLLLYNSGDTSDLVDQHHKREK